MRPPRNVVLLLITDTGEKHRSVLDEPNEATFSHALENLYLRLPDAEYVLEIRVAFDAPEGRQIIDCSGADISPEQIGSRLWNEMRQRLHYAGQ